MFAHPSICLVNCFLACAGYDRVADGGNGAVRPVAGAVDLLADRDEVVAAVAYLGCLQSIEGEDWKEGEEGWEMHFGWRVVCVEVGFGGFDR